MSIVSKAYRKAYNEKQENTSMAFYAPSLGEPYAKAFADSAEEEEAPIAISMDGRQGLFSRDLKI